MYAASELRSLLARGPQRDEDFFRMKVTGNGETRWINVSATDLRGFIAVLEGRA
jgi:hypothetical protein